MKHTTWPAPPVTEKLPPAFASHEELHSSPHYGPHICPQCYGAGHFVNRHGTPETNPSYGQLVRCTSCDRIANINNERFAEEIGNLWKYSGLNPQRVDPPSFDNFEVSPATQPLFDAFSDYAARPKGWLTVYGSRSSGKTHLAEAFTRHMLNHRVRCLYMLSPDLWEFCGAVERNRENTTDYESRRTWTVNVPLLVIDDLGVERNTEAVKEYRFRILDQRYRRALDTGEGKTVLISNEPPSNWADYRLSERAMDTRFVQVEVRAPSYRRLPR